MPNQDTTSAAPALRDPVERRYAMIHVKAGDYILPSNDAKQLWRIYRYDEDGSAEYGNYENGVWVGRKIIGTFWATARYDRPFHNAGEWTDPDFLEWNNWLTWETSLPSRKAAVESALREAVRVPVA